VRGNAGRISVIGVDCCIFELYPLNTYSDGNEVANPISSTPALTFVFKLPNARHCSKGFQCKISKSGGCEGVCS